MGARTRGAERSRRATGATRATLLALGLLGALAGCVPVCCVDAPGPTQPHADHAISADVELSADRQSAVWIDVVGALSEASR